MSPAPGFCDAGALFFWEALVIDRQRGRNHFKSYKEIVMGPGPVRGRQDHRDPQSALWESGRPSGRGRACEPAHFRNSAFKFRESSLSLSEGPSLSHRQRLRVG
jgi:hypothetical protein